jgi:hypothetical protein
MKKRGMVSTYTSAALPIVIAAAVLLCLPPDWQWTTARTWGAGLIIAAFVVRVIIVLVEWDMKSSDK